MTVTMSSEGDSSKNLSSESNEKSEAENTDSSQDVKDAKSDAAAENSVEKKDEDSKGKDAVKASSEESDKKADGGKTASDKAENAKSDVATSEKKEDKTKAKKEKEDEDSEQDDEKKEKDGDKDKEVPLLDQPLEKSGKRERKNVQRFNEDFPEPKEIEIPEGPGTPLGNIPRVDASISRFKNDDMKLLHKILFRTPGKNTQIKKNIKKFSGFEFKKDSDEYAKKLASVHKCEVKQLKSICEMLDLQKNGNKDDIVERILDFLMEPRDSGRAVGGGRPKRTAAVRANNRGYSSHDNYSSDEKHSGGGGGGRSGRDKGRRSNLKDDSSSASDEDFEPSDEGSDEKPTVTKRKRVERKKVESDDEDASEMDTASSEDSDFQDEPKNKRKKTVKTNNKTKGKGTGKRGRPAGKKTPNKAGKKKKQSSEEEEEEEEESEQKEEAASSSSEDEPLMKKATKAAQPPTDDEIKTYIKEYLEGANLEQITMKTVCQHVYAHYPDFDLAHKKDFIKSTVRSLIST